VCGWVSHPKINKNGKKGRKKNDERVLKKRCRKMIILSKRAKNKKKKVVFEFMLHYSFYITIPKKPKILNVFLPLSWPHYNPIKSPHDLWMHIFRKFVNIRVLLNVMSVYLHAFLNENTSRNTWTNFGEKIHIFTWVISFIFDFLVNSKDYLMCEKNWTFPFVYAW